ncbi:putative glucosylceramidase 3 [Sitodiplosis mosellana]|uniref:putative glucosylceramidase 3 n=1 Tax=Sitodiplosis mosellana TaxID=263140 RepID=UPI0024451082|nr:putative glucosylceramidase 3 [Sitodiplosis mosellana]
MFEQRNDVMEYADYISLHAYFDRISSPEILDEIYAKYDKQILYTEMSFAVFKGEKVLPGSWPRAEELIKILMETLQHNVAAYVDWNLILLETGGPSYLGSFIEAYILANEDFTVFYKQPLFYAMAHFAKFISPHSIRISSAVINPGKSQVITVAYLRPDNKVCVVLYNNGTNPVALTLADDLKGITKLQLKPKSLNTLIYSTRSG